MRTKTLNDGLSALPFNCREIIEEIFQPIIRCQVIEEGTHRHARPDENGDATQDIVYPLDQQTFIAHHLTPSHNTFDRRP